MKKVGQTIEPFSWGPTIATPALEAKTGAGLTVTALDRRQGSRFMAYKWATGFAVGTLGLVLYQLLGRYDLHRSTALLDTAVDRAIPLVPWTTWFYEPPYIAVFVIAVIGFRSRLLYNRALACVAANSSLGALSHYLIRAEYPRPVLVPPFADTSTAFLALIYRIDPPGNVFPSLHVAHTFMIAFILGLDRPRLGRLTLVIATLLAISTLTTKQHFIADVLAGLGMAMVARLWAARGIGRAEAGVVPGHATRS